MTECLSEQQLAAAASGEDRAAAVHAETCPRCRPRFAIQHEIAAAIGGLSPVPLASSRRRALAGAVQIAAQNVDLRAPSAGSRTWFLAVSGLAAAAAIAWVLGHGGATPSSGLSASRPSEMRPSEMRPSEAQPSEPRPSEMRPPEAQPSEPRPPEAQPSEPRPPEMRPSEAQLSEPRPSEAQPSGPWPSAARTSTPPAGSQVHSNESVFGGSRDIGSGAVVNGETWERPIDPPESAVASTAAFRSGWVALREHRDEDAIAAFDRAIDPAVREDAAFWAAIASKRAGHADAHTRFEAFLTAFPRSGHAAAATEQLRNP